MEPLITAAAGWLIGATARSNRGVLAAIALTVVAWVAALLAMAAYADVVLGAKSQPVWVGFASLTFAVAFFISSRKRS